MGSVLRFETAGLTMESPRLRSCCLHVIFTGVLSSKHDQKAKKIVSASILHKSIKENKAPPTNSLSLGCFPSFCSCLLLFYLEEQEADIKVLYSRPVSSR